jgi:hypothetical protein
MVALASLLLPVVLSALFVFVTSFLVHMVLKYHASDYTPLPNEDAVRAALRGVAPAQYIVPHAGDMKDLEKPEMKQKFIDGPVAVLEVKRPGPPTMTPMLVQWFIFTLVVSFFVAYVASHTLPPGTPYLQVFRVVGAVAFLAYAAGQIPRAIWMGKPWPVAWKEVFDGLLYGLVTAGTFGWLWPR